MKRRLLRLFLPVMIIRWPIWVLCWAKGKQSLSITLLDCTALRFWIDGNQQIWFVSLLLVLYIFYPYIYAVLYSPGCRRTIRITLLVLGACIFTLIVKAACPDHFYRYEIACTRIPVFLLGCALGREVYEKREISWKWWVIIAVCLVYAYGFLFDNQPNVPYSRWLNILAALPIAVTLSVIFGKIPQTITAPLRFLGKMSLELYLAHMGLRKLYVSEIFPLPVIQGNIFVWLLLIAVSIVLSEVAYYIENAVMKRLK